MMAQTKTSGSSTRGQREASHRALRCLVVRRRRFLTPWRMHERSRNGTDAAPGGRSSHAARALSMTCATRRPAHATARHRRLRDPELAGLQSGEMASRAHHLVLRELPADRRSCPAIAPFHPQYGYLFNSYYETVGTFFPRPLRGMLSRPTVDDVYRYRAHVDEHMRALHRTTGPAARCADHASASRSGCITSSSTRSCCSPTSRICWR